MWRINIVKKLSSVFLSAFAAALVLTSTAALAHGDVHPPKTTAFKKEQKDWGVAGDAKAAKRSIEVKMLDNMRFSPDLIHVKLGETVKFVVRNAGTQLHEFVIGTPQENQEHAALMVKFPSMEHSEPYMAHVAAGQKGEIIWTFNRAGEFEFACLIAGHYQAGMIGKIRVTAHTAKEK